MTVSRNVKFLFTIVITLFTLYFLFRGIPYAEIKEHFSWSWQISAVALVFFFAIKILNTLRFSVVYNIPPNWVLFLNLCYSNMMLSIIPFRFGELSYISRLQKITNHSYTEVTARLVKIRLLDYVSVYLILMLSSLFVYATFSSVVKIISLFFVASLIIGFFMLVLIVKLDLIAKVPIPKIARLLTALEQEIKCGFYTSLGNELKIFTFSVGYWILRLLLGYVVLVMLGIQLPFLMVTFISLSVFLFSLIPVQFFAGFGVTEAGFLFFLTQLGFEYNSTLILLLEYHFYLLFPVISLGVLGWIFVNLRLLGRSK